jgi:ankyrin repeat protein
LSQGELRRLRSDDRAVEAFIDAVNFKPLEMVQAAIEDGVNVNGIGSHGETALHYAAYYGKTERIQLLIDSGADVNIRDIDDHEGLSCGATPLNLAASSGFLANPVEVIDLLLAAGASPNIPDSNGNTPLMNAIRIHSSFISKFDCAARLVEAGADLEIRNRDGNTALMLALRSDHNQFVELLREAGASDYGVKEVALYKAVSAGDLEVVKQLLSQGDIDVNHSSPLAKACDAGHLDMVQVLIEAGTDVNQKEPGGTFGPLLRAAYGGHLEVVKLLLEAGADVSIINDVGYSALDYAKIGKAERRGDKPWDEIIKLLR